MHTQQNHFKSISFVELRLFELILADQLDTSRFRSTFNDILLKFLSILSYGNLDFFSCDALPLLATRVWGLDCLLMFALHRLAHAILGAGKTRIKVSLYLAFLF